MSAEEDAYHELMVYTLSHGDPRFIHQHIVDAWGAQRAVEGGKPIRLVFSLVGLYLHIEQGKSGREVQMMHMLMGRRKREWPPLELPDERGAITALDVMRAAPGPGRDAAIDAWCASVWAAYASSRDTVIRLLQDY